MELPRLGIRDLHHREPKPAENLEVRARVPAHLAHPADEKHRDVDPALHERARDDESVAAVVAAAAEHGHLPLAQVAVHRFHRGDRLPARVLHEDERRDADVLDGPAIGFAHLSGIQDAHCGRLARE